MGRTSNDSGWTCPPDKYSLYTFKPELPALSAFPIDGIRHKSRDSSVLNQVEGVLSDGPAVTTLNEIMRREEKLIRKKRTDKAYRSRTGKMKQDEALQQQSLQDDAGDEFTDKSTARGRAKKVRRRSRTPELELPELELPEIPKPANFPSGDLLTAVHAHTSRQLIESFNLLPALTDAVPRLPDAAIAHFDAINDQYAAEEEEAIRERSNLTTMKNIRSQWLSNRMLKGKNVSNTRHAGRKQAWKNADRAFDASALVALAMFVEISAEHSAGTLRPTIPQEAQLYAAAAPAPPSGGMDMDFENGSIAPLPLITNSTEV